MTLTAIKAMFQVGQRWNAENTLHPRMNGEREVVEKLSNQIVFKTATTPRGWLTMPKASQVIKAEDGLLVMRIDPSGRDTTSILTLRRIDGDKIPTLEGMENAPKEREVAIAEAAGLNLTARLLAPRPSISAKTGYIEQRSPLFAGSEANPQALLF
jgi:hypothetical protein